MWLLPRGLEGCERIGHRVKELSGELSPKGCVHQTVLYRAFHLCKMHADAAILEVPVQVEQSRHGRGVYPVHRGHDPHYILSVWRLGEFQSEAGLARWLTEMRVDLIERVPLLIGAGKAFPERDLLIFIAAGVILLSLIAGLSVPALAQTVSDDAAHGAVARIFAQSLANGQLSAEDRTYLAQLVAQRTNLSQADAERRVDEVFAKAHKAVEDAKLAAKQAADTASKVAAWTALWMFVALLCGAFFASLAATFGGRRRDAVVYLEPVGYVPATSPTPLR